MAELAADLASVSLHEQRDKIDSDLREAFRVLQTQFPPDFRQAVQQAVASESTDLRTLLGDLLICNSHPLNEAALSAVDQVLAREAATRPAGISDFSGSLTCATNSGTKVIVWRGDITALATDCIVNAANQEGLGCFQPSHRCIDNVIHRAAGPRLREACRTELASRAGSQLPAGSAPLVTPGFFLPARWVLHVTGPALQYGSSMPTEREETLLTACYSRCLDAAAQVAARSIAFCCVSTGLYGYPSKLAASTALQAVKEWLDSHPKQFDKVVFDVFTPKDDTIYHGMLPRVFPTVISPREVVDTSSRDLARASEWIAAADSVLVCAGAGMSVKQGEMVYTSQADFAKFYPNFRLTTEWEYTTAYECMGIFHDHRIPQRYRWGFWATHAMNQRYRFLPNDGYRALRTLIGSKDYFVYTSNADGCFARADFSQSQMFTPQGDWEWFQCAKPCRLDAYWPSKPMLEQAATELQGDGGLPESAVPKCSFCRGDTYPNVRGGDWFLETPHEAAKKRYKAWIRAIESEHKKLVILEIGAGFNTPMVTRYPMEELAKRVPAACLVRINPTEADVPFSVPRAVGIAEGWEAIRKLLDMQSTLRSS